MVLPTSVARSRKILLRVASNLFTDQQVSTNRLQYKDRLANFHLATMRTCHEFRSHRHLRAVAVSGDNIGSSCEEESDCDAHLCIAISRAKGHMNSQPEEAVVGI